MSQPAIRVRNLGLRFFIRSHQAAPTVHSGVVRFIKHRPPPKEFWALRNVSFDVPQGSVMGIIGANGSGKSTLLRVLARIYAPDEGTLKIRGKISSLITLGAGFQPNLSGMENIHYNGLLLGLSRQDIQDKLESIVAFAELGDFIDAPVRTYSSGMRARLGFSVAVHVDPEVLVVDEVLVVGDAKFRQKCADKMKELFTRGTTVAMVQHNMEAILTMCHQCLWLEKGSVREIGRPYDVVKHYLEAQGLPMIEVRSDLQAMDVPSFEASGGAADSGFVAPL
jgi:ABC-type polysaccharide/polyol phosphate transport system ATPase subunit